MNDTGKIIAAFAAGAVIGAIAGVLFAPDKGSETRRKISEQGKKMANSMKETFVAGKEKLKGLRENIKQNEREEVEEFS